MNLRSTSSTLAVVALFVAAPVSAQSDRCDERRTIEREISADGIRMLDVEARQGSLDIRGRSGAGQIMVTAELCAENASDLADLGMRLERVGSTAEVEALVPDQRDRNWRGQTRIDLTISIPEGLSARVVDGSGHTEIQGVGALEVTDGSGHLTIRNVAGDLVVDDGSGTVEIEDVTGSVTLEDGSGNATITDVGGDVEVDDGSGLIEIVGVRSGVHVTDKGSGHVRVDDVRGDLRVEGTRRERVTYSNVGGSLDLPPARRRRG